MLRSLRSTLIVASLLWTAGLLMTMHMLSLMLMHVFPAMSRFHAAGTITAGAGLMLAGAFGLRQRLVSFRVLREGLVAVRVGERPRLGGTYPTEVQPLIDELNALLEDREKAIERANATAGDLAQGLKTPLALLAHEAERADAAGNSELAESIAQQVERMSRQVNFHLARARAASGASGVARCNVAACTDALVRTLAKLYASRSVEISSSVPGELYARVHAEDLDEMLGNLLDNACKWATSRITLQVARSEAMLDFTLDDDGPGLEPALRTVVLGRGVRIDEAAPGSGLGLAIVRELAELYGGSICIEESPQGGLRARLSLPAAPSI